jgi:hypothetical protein
MEWKLILAQILKKFLNADGSLPCSQEPVTVPILSQVKPIHTLIYNLLLSSDVRSRDSAVGIATGYGLNDRGVGVRVSVGSRIFSSQRLDRLCGPHPMGTGGPFPGSKAAGA